MTISLNRYVNIVSGVGAAPAVPTRDLISRFFSANDMIPPQSFLSFTTAAEVGAYFGISSEEYLRAVFYFSWISKNLTKPAAIQFARWAQTAVPPMIFPLQNNGTSLAAWNAVSSGSLVLTMGTFTFTLAGMDFTGAGSLAAVAVIIEDAIQAETGGGSLWTAATVTYSATFGGFILTGGASGNAAVNVMVGGGNTDITGLGLLGWLPEATNVNGNLTNGAIFANGSAIETVTQTLTTSSSISNNFGSFAFLTNLSVTLQNVIDAAVWNKAQNVLYMFSQGVTPANAAAWAAPSTGSSVSGGVGGVGGTALTLSPVYSFQVTGTVTNSSNTVTGMTTNAGLFPGVVVSGTDIPAGTVITSLVGTTGLTLSNTPTGNVTELLTFTTLQFPEEMPMMIEGATNYAGINTVQNYEFQQFAGITPSVTTDALANTYDALGINYYGSTQNAGQIISFYQTGILQGQGADITDMNAYVNEIWLKDAASVAIMNLLLAVTQIGANANGRNQILGILQGIVNQALRNGTISVGKTLNTLQQSFITEATGDPLAWYQVQAAGYWLDVVITSAGSPLVYTATYTLIYSKDDVIRKVNGTHTLI